MVWRVKTLNATVDRELDALSADQRAQFVRIAGLIAAVGIERVGMPHVRHLTGPLWEMRLGSRDGIARALFVTAADPGGRGGAGIRQEDPAHTAQGDRAGVAARPGGNAMSTVEELHKRWSRDADYREAYERLGPAFEVARALIEARRRAGFTQAELAERMQTTQSAVARLESGRVPPSTRTLEKVARATGTRLRIRFEPA